MEGRFDAGRDLVSLAKRQTDEFGLKVRRGAYAMEAGYVELLAGDLAAAERELREGYDLLGSVGETGYRSTVGALLADALERQGHNEEAERILNEVAAIAAPDDVDPQARTRCVRARLLAKRGELVEAERVACEAVALSEQTDYLDVHGEALVALAEVLRAADRVEESATAVGEALVLYERKGNVVAAGRTRGLLSKLAAE